MKLVRFTTAGVVTAALFGLARAGVAASDAPAAGQAAASPLLSTSPTLPAGSVPEPTRMSGLPLQVTDLPLGTVAVRVIRRTFAENVVGQVVELYNDGTGRILTAKTDTEGRATFSGLSVGDPVRARAVVEEETLESDTFQVPGRGGMRTVLVAGVGTASESAALNPHAGEPSAFSSATPTSRAGSSNHLLTFRNTAVFALLAFAAGTLWFSRRPPSLSPRRPPVATKERSRSTAHRPVPDGQTTSSREELFEALVRLERSHQEPSTRGEEYAVRREELIEALVRLDAGAGGQGS